MLDEWLYCQRQWLYLEVIFSQVEIQKRLPELFAKFSRMDRIWKDFMRKIKRNPSIMEVSTSPVTLTMFVDANRTLEEIQKGLEQYLETKRVAFPRFYFLSNEDLLDILAQAHEPHSIQPHLRKCFDNVFQLDFSTEDVIQSEQEVIGLISAEKERLQLLHPVTTSGNVEEWLTQVSIYLSIYLPPSFRCCSIHISLN